jgi:hypothetical protein
LGFNPVVWTRELSLEKGENFSPSFEVFSLGDAFELSAGEDGVDADIMEIVVGADP